MKRVLLASLVCLAVSQAQDFVAPQPKPRRIIPQAEQPKPTIEGIVKEIFTRKPWQAVNPFAPKSYGSGERLVSKDFGPGTPYHSNTVTVVGVEW